MVKGSLKVLCFVQADRGNVLDDMREVFAKSVQRLAAELVEMHGEDDRVHLLMNFPESPALATGEQSQGRSQPSPAPDHSALRRRYWNGVPWSPSYFAGWYGAAPTSIIRGHIKEQRTSD